MPKVLLYWCGEVLVACQSPDSPSPGSHKDAFHTEELSIVLPPCRLAIGSIRSTANE